MRKRLLGWLSTAAMIGFASLPILFSGAVFPSHANLPKKIEADGNVTINALGYDTNGANAATFAGFAKKEVPPHKKVARAHHTSTLPAPPPTSPAHIKAAHILGVVNEPRGAATTPADASIAGQIAAYELEMKTALAIQDPKRRDAAITAARSQLAQATERPLTSAAVMRVDSVLDIQGASPALGTAR